jgi:hypothetical protein
LGARKKIEQFEALAINLAEGYQIERVEFGQYHTIVMVENAQGDKKIYGCGSNNDGQLGMGDRRGVKQFEELPFREQILKRLVEKERKEECSYHP